MYAALSGAAMHAPLDVQRVVLVVLDGLRADAIETFDLGHIAGLVAPAQAPGRPDADQLQHRCRVNIRLPRAHSTLRVWRSRCSPD
jgi:hypothetical protein